MVLKYVINKRGIGASLMNFGVKTINFLSGIEIGGITFNEYIKRMIYQVLADNLPELFLYHIDTVNGVEKHTLVLHHSLISLLSPAAGTATLLDGRVTIDGDGFLIFNKVRCTEEFQCDGTMNIKQDCTFEKMFMLWEKW